MKAQIGDRHRPARPDKGDWLLLGIARKCLSPFTVLGRPEPVPSVRRTRFQHGLAARLAVTPGC